jgi:predicted phosphate transport protein (TIGR00153 family)
MEFLRERLSYSPELRIIERINDQSTHCVSAVGELVKAIELVMISKDAGVHINSVNIEEEEADKVRRDIVEQLAKGVLPPLSKEDLMRLTWQQDKVAGWAKESAAVLCLLPAEKLPVDLKNTFIILARLAEEAALLLKGVIETLQSDYKKALEECLEVEECESRIDEQYQKTLRILTQYELDTVTLVLSNELARNIENIGDSAEDTSDLVKIIAINAFS